MRYHSYRVFGAVRSGNCYLAYLIGNNFFDLNTLITDLIEHTPSPYDPGPRIASFYVWRKFDDFSRSFYNLRTRFGIGNVTYEEFLQKPLGELCTFVFESDCTCNHGDRTQRSYDRRTAFADSTVTIKQYWTTHLRKWFDYARTREDVLVVSYDALVAEFEGTMHSIALHLGTPKQKFRNVKERIGWYPTGTFWDDPSKRSEVKEPELRVSDKAYRPDTDPEFKPIAPYVFLHVDPLVAPPLTVDEYGRKLSTKHKPPPSPEQVAMMQRRKRYSKRFRGSKA
jgi:hypothetical protein